MVRSRATNFRFFIRTAANKWLVNGLENSANNVVSSLKNFAVIVPHSFYAMHCVVLCGKHPSPLHRFFFGLIMLPPTSLEISVLVSTFLSKFWLLKPSSSFNFPITPLSSGWALVFSGTTHISSVSLVNHVHYLHVRLVQQSSQGAGSMLTEHILRRLLVGMCFKHLS